jgi:hypothetical protein
MIERSLRRSSSAKDYKRTRRGNARREYGKKCGKEARLASVPPNGNVKSACTKRENCAAYLFGIRRTSAPDRATMPFFTAI